MDPQQPENQMTEEELRAAYEAPVTVDADPPPYGDNYTA